MAENISAWEVTKWPCTPTREESVSYQEHGRISVTRKHQPYHLTEKSFTEFPIKASNLILSPPATRLYAYCTPTQIKHTNSSGCIHDVQAYLQGVFLKLLFQPASFYTHSSIYLSNNPAKQSSIVISILQRSSSSCTQKRYTAELGLKTIIISAITMPSVSLQATVVKQKPRNESNNHGSFSRSPACSKHPTQRSVSIICLQQPQTQMGFPCI